MSQPVFDPTLLTTFVTVAKANSFTEAGRRLGLRQSTVSQHVRRLEQAASRRLFVRDTHSVALTTDGEAMLGLARGILEANDRDRGTPHGTTPPTPPGIRVTYHGGSTGLGCKAGRSGAGFAINGSALR